MHIISQKRIKEAVEKYPNSADALLAWLKMMRCSNPRNFAELKEILTHGEYDKRRFI